MSTTFRFKAADDKGVNLLRLEGRVSHDATVVVNQGKVTVCVEIFDDVTKAETDALKIVVDDVMRTEAAQGLWAKLKKGKRVTLWVDVGADRVLGPQFLEIDEGFRYALGDPLPK